MFAENGGNQEWRGAVCVCVGGGGGVIFCNGGDGKFLKSL